MPHAAPFVPPERAADHLLLVPADDSLPTLPELVGAWFPDPTWLREPVVPPERPSSGARFRGLRPSKPAEPVPGLLRVGEEHGLHGPFPVDAEQAADLGMAGPASAWALTRIEGEAFPRSRRPASYDDRDGISRAFAAGLPEGEELRAVQWAVAAARKVGGVVLVDGQVRLAPDPRGAVDLTLYSARAMAAADLLHQVRVLVATAEIEAQSTGIDGAAQYTVVGRTPYDGAVSVRVERVDRVPRSLAGLDWQLYGPFTYHLGWVPQDPYELQTEQPSGLHLIARGRMRVLLARLASGLHERLEGVFVDDGGFVVGAAELAGRLDDQEDGARAWV
ncbi:hypothetical protein DNL40_08105 [Xylanimonas oleitrophica]|uniref:Uncharacterized protein n=1 Tax=Xylanimonas oleitrophica TaxID=2607479 RepID=A0A2W5WPH0_9MICO|nr:hypothetical protein [Xylanimonas oleitrophica]PZR53459.1 hypothetical protein DNL40_08105 [Xylanimonas oleitrophica]